MSNVCVDCGTPIGESFDFGCEKCGSFNCAPGKPGPLPPRVIIFKHPDDPKKPDLLTKSEFSYWFEGLPVGHRELFLTMREHEQLLKQAKREASAEAFKRMAKLIKIGMKNGGDLEGAFYVAENEAKAARKDADAK